MAELEEEEEEEEAGGDEWDDEGLCEWVDTAPSVHR